MGIENPEVLSDNGPTKNVTVNDLTEGTFTNRPEFGALPPVDNAEDTELNELQDIEELLGRETHDGPGDLDALPESDFVSHATDGVEKESN